jgi:hypothetical protein
MDDPLLVATEICSSWEADSDIDEIDRRCSRPPNGSLIKPGLESMVKVVEIDEGTELKDSYVLSAPLYVSGVTMLFCTSRAVSCNGGTAFGFPARLDGLYPHSVPVVRHREQIGLSLLHLTLAKKHPSQEALNRGCRGLEVF